MGHRLESIVHAHSGQVNALASAPDGICSVASDGLVKIWTRFLECRLIIELKNLRAINVQVRCIDWDYELGRIALATAACEVFEISTVDGENIHSGALVEGHSGEELWGLAANPAKEEFCTVGDDAILRVWDLHQHHSTTTIALEMPARCCAYSPDGKHIAIGFGAPKKLSDKQFDGKWIVVDTFDYQVSHEARDSSKWLRFINYSPNGQTIVIGSEDTKIYIYNVAEGYALNAVIAQHHAYIMSVDFSDDSKWIRSNCAGFELCYFEAEMGLYIPAASRLRDVNWATQHCTMDWAAQGLWQPYKDGTEYTCSDANIFRGEDGIILASGSFACCSPLF
jgi:WD40 repeat protein